MLITWIAVFILSLFVLVKASDYFIDSAEKIGIFFGVPSFIIGVSIVALGTSLPELISSLFAVFKDSSEVVVGNVVGSNVANVFLVMGVAAVVGGRLTVTYELAYVDLPLLVGSAFLFAAMIWDGDFTLPEALLCVAGAVLYLGYSVSVKRKPQDDATKRLSDATKRRSDAKKLGWKCIIILVVSAFFIYLGAKYTIESVIRLSQILNIGKEVIAVSAIAFGTSVPELMVTVRAARKGKAELALGNVLGSNIYNVFAVMGISGLFGTLIIPPSILTLGLPMMLIATLLYFVMTQAKVMTKWEGFLLVMFYVLFVGKLFRLF